MTHDELLQHVAGHHHVAAEIHGRLAKAHGKAAEHHSLTDPMLGEIHDELADCHKRLAAHHTERALALADVDVKAAGGDLNALHKALGGE